jgi:hypothetical protein
VTGVWWRRLALLAVALVNLHLFESITEWVPGPVGMLVALVAVTVFMLAFLLMPLRDRPQCGWEFPVVMPDARRTHHVHHCADERGHIDAGHTCRCGLGFLPGHTTRQRDVTPPDGVTGVARR